MLNYQRVMVNQSFNFDEHVHVQKVRLFHAEVRMCQDPGRPIHGSDSCFSERCHQTMQ
jgi:hypothetical protein